MFALTILMIIFFKFSSQQLHFDCLNRSITLNAQIYLSSPDFPKTLSWQDRPNCYFEFKNSEPVVLIFTNAYLCNVMIKTSEKETLIPILDTNLLFYRFKGRNLSMHILPISNKTDQKCEWQAFQAFAQDPINNRFHNTSYSEIINKDLIYVATVDSLTFIEHNIVNKLNRPQIEYFVHIYNSGITFTFNKNFEKNNSFYLFIAVAGKEIEWNSNCVFKQSNSNEWTFSLYDIQNGYGHNMHCVKLLKKTEASADDYRYKLWFEEYQIESNFDNVAIETTTELDPFILKNSKYIAQYTDLMLKFDSDGLINQAGFILHIQKYACSCDASVVVLPCNGSTKRGMSLDFDNPFSSCNQHCVVQIQFEKNCTQNFFEINYQVPLDPFIRLYITSPNGNDIELQSFNLLLYYDPLGNYSIARELPTIDLVNTIDDYQFWVDLKIVPNLKTMTVVLNSTNWIFYETLSKLEKIMVTIQRDSILQAKNYIVETFVVYTTDQVTDHLYLYHNSMKDYIGSYDDHGFSFYDFVPRSIRWYNEFSFYFEKLYDDGDGIVFIRIRELDRKNCMFEHNVIDFNTLTTTNNNLFTMINNGSGLCKSTFLNIWNAWSNNIQGIFNLWTTAEENVIILDRNHNKILEFNKRNASEISQLELNDSFYEVFLPSNSSLAFEGFIK